MWFENLHKHTCAHSQINMSTTYLQYVKSRLSIRDYLLISDHWELQLIKKGTVVRFLEVGVVAIEGHLPRLLKGPCFFPHKYCGETGLSLVASSELSQR